MLGSVDIAQLTECLPSMHEAMGLTLGLHYLGRVVHAYSLSTWGVEASPVYMRIYLTPKPKTIYMYFKFLHFDNMFFF